MKQITINYLSHNRLNYTDLMFYFLSKIKLENKSKIKLNVLATHENDWKTKCCEYDLMISISAPKHLQDLCSDIESGFYFRGRQEQQLKDLKS